MERHFTKKRDALQNERRGQRIRRSQRRVRAVLRQPERQRFAGQLGFHAAARARMKPLAFRSVGGEPTAGGGFTLGRQAGADPDGFVPPPDFANPVLFPIFDRERLARRDWNCESFIQRAPRPSRLRFASRCRPRVRRGNASNIDGIDDSWAPDPAGTDRLPPPGVVGLAETHPTPSDFAFGPVADGSSLDAVPVGVKDRFFVPPNATRHAAIEIRAKVQGDWLSPQDSDFDSVIASIPLELSRPRIPSST